eukprot:5018148-Pyramimonas_sp.AAC.1
MSYLLASKGGNSKSRYHIGNGGPMSCHPYIYICMGDGSRCVDTAANRRQPGEGYTRDEVSNIRRRALQQHWLKISRVR